MRSQVRVRYLLSAVLLALSSSGCWAPRFVPPGAELSSVVAHDRCGALLAHQPRVETVRALLDATIIHNDDRIGVRYAVLFRRPDAVRIDLLPEQGAYTLGMLVTRRGETVLLDTQERRFSVARDDRELFERFLGVSGVSGTLVAGLVSGSVPALECARVSVFDDAGSGSVTIIDRAAQTAWEVDSARAQLRGVTVLDRDAERIQLKAQRFEAVGEQPARLLLEIFSPARARVEMTIQKLTLGAQIPGALFEVKIPESYRQE